MLDLLSRCHQMPLVSVQIAGIVVYSWGGFSPCTSLEEELAQKVVVGSMPRRTIRACQPGELWSAAHPRQRME